MAAILSPPQPATGRIDEEDGPQARRVFSHVADGGPNAIIGFRSDVGVRRNLGRAGARSAPLAIRESLWSLAAPENLGLVSDYGDVDVTDGDLEAGQALLADVLAQTLPRHSRVIVLGGGHETALGSYMGLRSAYPADTIGIINLDAHLDLRCPREGSGTSGTPFWQIRALDPEGFDYLCIGVARESNTAALIRRAGDWGVRVIYDEELVENPCAAEGAIDALVERSRLVYLTIDMDVLPHYQAPGVSAPAIRGVPFTTIESIVASIRHCCHARNRALPLADIVEVSPALDVAGVTARSAAFLALSLLVRGEMHQPVSRTK